MNSNPFDSFDAARLNQTLLKMLRYSQPSVGLLADSGGWYPLEDVVRAISVQLQAELVVADLENVRRLGGVRWEINAGRIRILPDPGRHYERPQYPDGPDILYHVVSAGRLADLRWQGVLAGPQGRPVPLTRVEEQAWKIGHRRWEDPVVLVVDAARARRDGLRFVRSRSGQYQSAPIPLRHILNLREHYAEQASAGGFLVEWTTGQPRIALVRVVRRSGITWEVAKGKLELGEQPLTAAVREVREEMGISAHLDSYGSIGTIRYGFSTPDGQPRLKTIYLYLLESREPVQSFSPARAEGIEAVRWFCLDEALRMLTHPSLRSSINRLITVMYERAHQLGIQMEAPGHPGLLPPD